MQTAFCSSDKTSAPHLWEDGARDEQLGAPKMGGSLGVHRPQARFATRSRGRGGHRRSPPPDARLRWVRASGPMLLLELRFSNAVTYNAFEGRRLRSPASRGQRLWSRLAQQAGLEIAPLQNPGPLERRLSDLNCTTDSTTCSVARGRAPASLGHSELHLSALPGPSGQPDLILYADCLTVWRPAAQIQPEGRGLESTLSVECDRRSKAPV